MFLGIEGYKSQTRTKEEEDALLDPKGIPSKPREDDYVPLAIQNILAKQEGK